MFFFLLLLNFTILNKQPKAKTQGAAALAVQTLHVPAGVCEHWGGGAFQSPYQFSEFRQSHGNADFGDLRSHFCRSREPLPPPCLPACRPADLHQLQIVLHGVCCASLMLCTAVYETAWYFLPFANKDKVNNRAQRSQICTNELRVEYHAFGFPVDLQRA